MKVDHWLWCAMGLRGIVGIARRLAEGQVPASTAAIKELEKNLADLQAVTQLARQPGAVQDHEAHNPDNSN